MDDALRRQRAAERAELVAHWARRHGAVHPRVPAHVREVTTPLDCDACRRTLGHGRYVEVTPDDPAQPAAHLCVTCGRRALLDWADRRRQEAAAARQLSQSLGDPEQPPARQLELSAEPPHAEAAIELTTGVLGALADAAQPPAASDDPRAA